MFFLPLSGFWHLETRVFDNADGLERFNFVMHGVKTFSADSFLVVGTHWGKDTRVAVSDQKKSPNVYKVA